MDFSSSERALLSLQRREPTLSPEIQSLSHQLLPLQSNPLQDIRTYLQCTRELLQLGTTGSDTDTTTIKITTGSSSTVVPNALVTGSVARWEPLAVGLHMSISFFEAYRQRIDHSSSGGVFMDGPRVPAMRPTTSSISSNDDIPNPNTTTTTTTTTTPISSNELIEFCSLITTLCQTHLEHNEPRVRTLVAKAAGEHTKLATTLLSATSEEEKDAEQSEMGGAILAQSLKLYRLTCASLYEHLEIGREAAIALANAQEANNNNTTNETDNSNIPSPTTKINDPTQKVSNASGGALDDTTGWRALETNLYGVGSFICASNHWYFRLAAMTTPDNDDAQDPSVSGWDVSPLLEKEVTLDEELMEAVNYCCVTHINRHVRAAGINVLEQMVHASTTAPSSTTTTPPNNQNSLLLTNPQSKLQTTIVQVLQETLADNWSQVRMAASVLCRVFFQALLQTNPSTPIPQTIYLKLIPRMCLNRFYLAQGVKLYSHETWRLLFDREGEDGGGGMEAVAKCAGAVCRYYVKMCDADNHVVREAGCQAVAELANKLGRSEEYKVFLAPFVPILLQALLMCFHDESWPVRDEACLACGIFCIAYPAECEPELPILFQRWTEQLTDQIWSVREDAAVALGDAIEAYGTSMMDKVLDVLRRDLSSARKEPAMTMEEYKRRQNDIDSHTDSQLYSCGSLAPKLRKGGAGRIGCGDCQVTRPKAPWEATDGCIYLIRELCVRLCTAGGGNGNGAMVLTDDILLPIMQELVDVCRVQHFPQSDDLRTTLWKQLPVIANALGKQRFKRIYLQLFLELLMKNLDDSRPRGSTSKLSVHAAGQCAGELGNLVGNSIFRGRLEEDWQGQVFDRVMEERRQRMQARPAGPVMEDGFSPFGPSGMMVPSSPMDARLNADGVSRLGGVSLGGATGSHFVTPGTSPIDVL